MGIPCEATGASELKVAARPCMVRFLLAAGVVLFSVRSFPVLGAGDSRAQILLTPVHPPGDLAPYPTETVIDGQVIKIPYGGVRLWFEFYVRNWDPDHDGSPRLHVLYARLAENLAKGINAIPQIPGVDIVPASQICTTEADCRLAVVGGFCGYPLLDCGGRCCFPAYQDGTRSDWILTGHQGVAAINADPPFAFGALAETPPGIVDHGTPLYFSTIVADAPSQATGRYAVPLKPDECYMRDDTTPVANTIPVEVVGAVIFIGEDCNNNLNVDDLDISKDTSADVDGDGVPDECEADCQSNGIPDDSEIASGQSLDCNANGVPDECEAATCGDPGCRDCNGNARLDECDIANGLEGDIDGNGVPDTCVPIPTLTAWGAGILTLILLTAAKVQFRRRAAV